MNANTRPAVSCSIPCARCEERVCLPWDVNVTIEDGLGFYDGSYDHPVLCDGCDHYMYAPHEIA